MVISRADTALKQKERIIKDIITWNRGNERVLNIISIPYNKCDVFEVIIDKYIKENKKVLYIVNDDDGTEAIIEMLKLSGSKNFCCNLDLTKKVVESKPVVIATYESTLLLQQGYELVIYDEGSSLSKYSRFEILDLLSPFYRKGSKIICRSMECVFQNSPCFELPIREKGLPLIEPRIITTRIDLTKEIPTVIYDYLKWSIKSGRNVVIFTPSEEISQVVYNYLLSIKEALFTNILLHNDKRNKEMKYFLEKRKGIIVTSSMDIMKMKIENTDFIVYMAEDRHFEYKKLVYICSKASSLGGPVLGEVILLANETVRDMEVCKDILRRFNKQIWELGLVRA